jgi:hypothetical protein
MHIELHRSLNSALITKSGTSEDVVNILLLGYMEAIGGTRNLNPKEVAKRTKIIHEELLTKMGFNKSNVLRVVTSNDHVIDIEEKKSPTMRRCVDKERMVMCVRDKASESHHKGETLKSGARVLLKAIDGTPETADHAFGNRVSRRWLHIYLLT